jgi:hypothetical protein
MATSTLVYRQYGDARPDFQGALYPRTAWRNRIIDAAR